MVKTNISRTMSEDFDTWTPETLVVTVIWKGKSQTVAIADVHSDKVQAEYAGKYTEKMALEILKKHKEESNG